MSWHTALFIGMLIGWFCGWYAREPRVKRLERHADRLFHSSQYLGDQCREAEADAAKIIAEMRKKAEVLLSEWETQMEKLQAELEYMRRH